MKKTLVLILVVILTAGQAGAIQALSNEIYLVINDGPSFSGQPPASQTRFVGEEFSLTVVVEGDGNMSYQWRKDGADIPGETADTLTINSVVISDTGDYSCFVQSDLGLNNESSTCSLTVYEGLGITQHPWSQTVSVGEEVGFTVTADGGTPPLSYQWLKDGADIPGATDSAYSISSVVLADAGDYSCRVSDSTAQEVVSNEASLTVLEVDEDPIFILSHTSGEETYTISVDPNSTPLANILSQPGDLPQGTDYSNVSEVGIFCRLSASPWTVLENHPATLSLNTPSTPVTFTGDGVDWSNNPTGMDINGASFEANFYILLNNASGRWFINPDYVLSEVNGTEVATSDGMYQISF